MIKAHWQHTNTNLPNKCGEWQNLRVSETVVPCSHLLLSYSPPLHQDVIIPNTKTSQHLIFSWIIWNCLTRILSSLLFFLHHSWKKLKNKHLRLNWCLSSICSDSQALSLYVADCRWFFTWAAHTSSHQDKAKALTELMRRMFHRSA